VSELQPPARRLDAKRSVGGRSDISRNTGSRTPDSAPLRSVQSVGPTSDAISLFQKCREFTRAKELDAAGLYPYFRPISDSADTSVIIAYLG